MNASEYKLRFAVACEEGDLLRIRRWIVSGKQVPKGALTAAVAKEKWDVINFLLEQDPVPKDQLDKALWVAISRSNRKAALHLLHYGASPNARPDKFDPPVLVLAAEKGMEDIVEELLGRGAYVDLIEMDFINASIGNRECGRTALMAAVTSGHVAIVNRLMQAGASVDLRDCKGRTALDLASRSKAKRKLTEALKEMKLTFGRELPEENDTSSLLLEIQNTVESLAAQSRLTVSHLRGGLRRLSQSLSLSFQSDLKLTAIRIPAEIADALAVNNLHGKRSKLEHLQDIMTGKGYQVFRSYDQSGFMLCFFEGKDKYSVFQALDVGSVNYDISPSDLRKFFYQMEKENPFRLLDCARSGLRGRFLSAPKNSVQTAKRLMDFCPFVAADHRNRITTMAKFLREERIFNVWWD